MSDNFEASVDRALSRQASDEYLQTFFNIPNIESSPVSSDVSPRSPEMLDKEASQAEAKKFDQAFFEANRAAKDQMVADIAATTEDPQKMIDDWDKAKLYAKLYNVDDDTAYRMLPQLEAHYWGSTNIGKTNAKAVVDTFSAAATGIKIGLYGHALTARKLLGTTQFTEEQKKALNELGFLTPEQKDEEIKGKITELMKVQSGYQLDILPRHWTVSAAKMVASAIPYTMYAAGTGVVAGLVSGGTGAGVALKAMIANTMNFYTSFAVLQGMDYTDMIANGVPDDIAIPASMASGAIQTVMERVLGIEGTIKNIASKTTAQGLIDKITKDFLVKGGAASVAKAMAVRYGFGTLSEMAEEGGQAIGSGAIKMIAESIAQQRARDENLQLVIQNPTTILSIAEDAWNGILAAAVSAPLLGLAPSFLAARQDIAQLENFAKIAPKMPKDAFQNLGDSLGLLPDISPEARSEAFGQMYDTALTRDKEYKERLAVEGKRRPGLGQDTVIERHGPEDSILMTAATGGETDNGIAARMQFGTRNDRAQYGGIDIRFDGNTVVFEGAELTEGYEAIVDEAISQIMERFQGRDFRVSEDANYLLQGAFERVSKGQEEIKADVVRAKNAAEKQVVYEEIARAMPAWTESEVKSAADIFELVAGMTGTSIGKLRSAFNESDFIVSKSNMGKAAGSFVTMATSNISLQRAHQVMTRRARGEQILDATEQLVHAHIRLRKDEKLDTFLHEMLHFAEAVMEGDPIMEKIRDHYGRRLDRHAVSEKFVADVMAVMSSQGGLDTLNYAPEVKSIIKTIADFLKKVWHILAEGGSVDPKVEAEIIRMLDRAANIYGKPTTTSDVMPDYIYEQVLKTKGGIQDSDIKVVEEYLSGILENVNNFIAHSRGSNRVTASQYRNAIMARLKKVRDGTWKNDPQLIVAMKAYIDKQNGEEMDEYVAGCVDIAKMGMDVDGMSYDGMDETTVIPSYLDSAKYENYIKSALPESGFFDYQDSTMEKKHKELFYDGVSDWQYADWIENAGDIARELSSKQAHADPSYIGEKLRKILKAFPSIDSKTIEGIPRDYVLDPTVSFTFATRNIKTVSEYVEMYNNYNGRLGSLGESIKSVSMAIAERNGKKLISSLVDFIARYNQLREYQGFDKFKVPEVLNPLVNSRMEELGINNANVDAIHKKPDAHEILLHSLDIFKNDAQREQVKQEQEEELRKEAKSFSSWQDWVDYLFPGIDMKTLTEQEKNYYRQTWEYAKRDVKPKYAKGELVKYLANPSNMYGLLREAAKAIQEAETSTDEVVKRHGQEIRDAISETPELLSAINKIIKGDGIRHPNPELLSAADRKAIVDLTRKNESLIKFFLARVSGDTDLAFEAQAELGRIPESQKYNFFARPGRTIAEQASILEAIQDEEIREKILDGTITEKELNEFMRKKYRETRDRERKKGEEKLKAFKDRVKERDAARKLHAQIRKLREFIMRPPSTGIGNKAYQYIRFIQEYLEKGRPVDVTKLRNAASVVFVNQPGAAEGLVKLLSSLSNRQFNEFTLNELQTLADMFDNWMRKGRAELRSKQYEAHIEMKVLRDLALDSFKNNKYFKKEMKTYQSQEMRDQADSFWTRLRQVAIDHMRPDAFYRKYFDGMQNGKSMEIFTDLLCDQVMQGQHGKLSQYARRTDHIMDFIRDKSNHMYNTAGQIVNEDGIGLDRRIVLEGIGVEDSDFTVSANDLIGISMLIGTKTEFSQSQREAFIYGVLFSENEKNPSGSEFGMGGDRNAYMMKKYNEKLNGLLDAINANLTRKEWELRNMMMEVLNTPDDWVRFANGVIEMTGKEPTFEKYYFPIVRQTMVDYAEDEILDKTKFGSGNKAKYVEAFMTLDRSRKIQPRNQKPVKYNGTQVFFDAVMRQEHLTNMGPLVKKLNGIFHSNVFSDILRGNIRNSLGQQALDYLDSHLEAVAAPLAPRERIPGESSLSLARGGVIIGNLAWRWSSILMQLTTSPLPFLSEAPGELMAVAAEAWASGHPIKWYQEIEEKSSELKYRQMDNVHAEITGLQEKGFTGNFKRFAQAGMLGLYHVDRLSVAIGWEAVYRKKFREFHAQMNEESATRMAKEYADKVVARTQPSVDPTQRAPVYRNQNEFQKLIYQFTQPLNVIWNNIAYDMPQALKEREYGRFLGFLAGYALSGLAVGATRALRGRGPKEDEDDERNARRWAQFWMYSASTQFLEAVPLAGDMISSLMRAFITGESRLMGDTNMPAMGLLYEAMAGILKAQKDGEWTGQEIEKVLGTAAYGTLMAVGAPALGFRETVEAAKKVAGIGDKE